MANNGKRSEQAAAAEIPFFAREYVGTALTVASGLAFLFVCMILPIVGKAGSVVSHARENFLAFLTALLVSLALAVLAAVSKLERRKLDGSPMPTFSFLLGGLCALLLVALLTGLLKI